MIITLVNVYAAPYEIYFGEHTLCRSNMTAVHDATVAYLLAALVFFLF